MTRLALLVVDMQAGLFSPDMPRHDAEGLVERLNALAARLRQDGHAIVFIQHEGPSGSGFHPSQPGHALHPGLDVRPGDVVVGKTACDAFLDSELERALEYAGAEALVITGCATEYCVDTTVRSALGRGWRTIVPSDGHTTADRPHLPAAKIIQHHNAIWGDFVSPAGPARICRCVDIGSNGTIESAV